jgi:hypothetical protein
MEASKFQWISKEKEEKNNSPNCSPVSSIFRMFQPNTWVPYKWKVLSSARNLFAVCWLILIGKFTIINS